MPKERSVNPVQAQRKADKAKAIKKGAHDDTVTQRRGTLELTTKSQARQRFKSDVTRD